VRATCQGANALISLLCDGVEERTIRGFSRVDLDDLAGLGVLERQETLYRKLPIETIPKADRDDIVTLRESAELWCCLLDPGIPEKKIRKNHDDRAPLQAVSHEA
jgi:hypothetical protein